jgi:hypothetical protein
VMACIDSQTVTDEQYRRSRVIADVGRSEGKRDRATLDEIGQEKQRVSERLVWLDTERAQWPCATPS